MTFSPDARPRLLLTRPREGSERFSGAFRARFGATWPVTIAPLTRIVPTEVEVPAAWALIFTSEQAVAPAIAHHPANSRRAWCVGKRTAEAARTAGFDVFVGPGDARGLAQKIIAGSPSGPLVHVRGAEIAFPLAETLNSAGIETHEAIAYRQEPCSFDGEARALLQGEAPLLVPVFSPAGGRLLVQAVQGARAPLWLAPISEAVARACAPISAARCEIAERPEAVSVLDALERLMGAGKSG